MSDLAGDNRPTARPQTRPATGPVLLPLLLFFAAMILSVDFTVISLRPLKALQIPYPRWLDYSHFLIPGSCAAAWLVMRHWWPNASAILTVVLCFTLVPLVPRYAENQIAKVPVTRWIDGNDLKSIEDRLGVPISEQGSRDGTVVMVAPANELRIRTELARLALLGG